MNHAIKNLRLSIAIFGDMTTSPAVAQWGDVARPDLLCENCGEKIDIMNLPDDCFHQPTLPNTLSGLKDRNNVDFKCPKCGFWHLHDRE